MVENEDYRQNLPSDLSEEILGEKVRLRPEAVVTYSDLGSKRVFSPKIPAKLLFERGNFEIESPFSTRRRSNLRRAWSRMRIIAKIYRSNQ